MLLGTMIDSGQLARVQMAAAPFDPVHFGSYTLFARSPDWNAAALKRFRQWLRKMVDQVDTR